MDNFGGCFVSVFDFSLFEGDILYALIWVLKIIKCN